MSRVRAARAFTLVEALCVVALLGLAAALFASGLIGASEGHRGARIEGDLRRVDAFARLAARRPTAIAVRIAILDEGRAIAALAGDGPLHAEPIASASFEAGTLVSFDPPQEAGALRIDGNGRSVDVAYLVARGGRVTRLVVVGATGQIEKEGDGRGTDAPPP